MADASLSAMFARDPAAAARYRRLMQAQALTAASRQPARSHLEGASRLVDALVGGLETGQVEREMRQEGERRQADRQAMTALFNPMAAAVAGEVPPAEPPAQVTPVSMPAPRPQAAPASAPADLMPHFEAASQATGIPVPLLVAQARQESNLNPNAVGRAGEIGIGQILPSTARQPGFGVPPVDPATLRDPAANIMFQARYLAGRGQAAGVTDWNDPAQVAKALAAYNGGGDPNYVQNVTRFLPPGAGTVETSGTGGSTMAPPAPQPAVTPARAPLFNPQQEQALARMLSSGDPEMVAFAQGQIQLAQLRQRQEPTPVPGRDVPLPAAVEEQRARLAQASRPQVTVDASQRAETAEGTARGKTLAEEGERVRLAAETGAGTIDNVRYVRSIAAGTGRLAPAKEVIGGWLDALGINSRLVRDAADLQAFTAAASQAVLGRQMEQRGVQTDSDARRMEQTFAQIRNTPQGNEFILRAAEAQATRAMERAEFYQQWRAQRGTLDGALEAWTRVIRETPLVYRGSDGEITFLNEFLASAQATNTPREEALAVWRRNAR